MSDLSLVRVGGCAVARCVSYCKGRASAHKAGAAMNKPSKINHLAARQGWQYLSMQVFAVATALHERFTLEH
jgi:hypothetical protein